MGTAPVPGGSILMTNTKHVTVNAPVDHPCSPLAGCPAEILASRTPLEAAYPNFINLDLKLVNYSPNANTTAENHFSPFCVCVCVLFLFSF